VDVSELFLNETASRLRKEFPGLRVEPVVADMSRNITPPPALRHPVLWALLGSTIGNFEDSDAVRLLARMRQSMRSDDRLLLGADLVKSRSVLEAAYNDTQGVTAAFNRNALHVLNRETGADFRPDAFAHRAVFNESDGRIEMYLVSVRDQLVQVPGLPTIRLPRGDSIRTEISNKYSPARLEQMLAQADLDVAQWATDDAGGYALMLAAPKGQ
jgi:L-histidine N-alpha-methyltransferase